MGAPSRKAAADGTRFRSDSTSRRNSGSSGQACSRNAARFSCGWAIAPSNNSSTLFHRSACIDARLFEFTLEPYFGEAPVPNDRVRRDLQNIGSLFHIHATEIAQLHYPRLAGIELREPVERLVQSDQCAGPGWRKD